MPAPRRQTRSGKQDMRDQWHFRDRWLAEAIRLRLDPQTHTADTFSPAQLTAAENLARQSAAGPEARLLRWATELAGHTRLHDALVTWRQRAGLVLLLMLVMAFGAGLSAALGVMGSGQLPVNVLWALGTLLGVNVVMLLFWLLSLSMQPGALSAGRLWFWLSARFYGRDALTLAQSFSSLSHRAGATRWWLSGVTHLVWSAALTGALCGLLLALSLRNYAFIWETTILPASLFTSLVQSLGALPALLGFPVPDADTVRAAGVVSSDVLIQSDSQRRAWAGWLCGAVLIYGVLPRLLLLALSGWKLRSKLMRLTLDLHSTEWFALSARLSPASETLGVTDPAPGLSVAGKVDRSHLAAGHAAPLVVGFELGDHILWPPDFPAVNAFPVHERVSSRLERERILRQMDQASPRALLLVCDAAQTIDRGSLAWLTEASGRVLHVAVWLAGESTDTRRALWRQQLQALGLSESAVFDSVIEAGQWLENHS